MNDYVQFLISSIVIKPLTNQILQTAKYLLKTHHIDVNAMDANGNTALDILAQSRRGVNDLSIGECLREAGGLRAKDIQNCTKISNGSAGNNNSEVSTPPV